MLRTGLVRIGLSKSKIEGGGIGFAEAREDER